MILYIPGYLDPEEKHPLVIALSPSADSDSMIRTWQQVADNHQWFIAASTQYRNGPIPFSLLETIVQDAKSIIADYPVDSSKIIASGFSGGAMGSHMLALNFPDFIRAVVANTGMINKNLRKNASAYPKGKLCVFLASPADFRYNDMQDDRKFLESLGWRTNWIEFSDGHTFAPSSVYEEAAAWLETAF